MTTRFQRFLTPQMRVHVMQTARFKTTSICMNIGIPLDEQRVTAVSMIAHMMRRVNRVYSTPQAFRERLESLYGASFSVDLEKRANHQIVSLSMDVINDEYVSDGESIVAEAFRFLFDCLNEPLVVQHSFPDSLVREERTTIARKLAAVQNDKMQYAAKRCLEELCTGKPYRLSVNGLAEWLDTLDGASLYDHFQRLLADAIIDFYVVGPQSVDQIAEILVSAQHSVQAYLGQDAARYSLAQMNYKRFDLQEFNECLEVAQAKLNIGLTSTVTASDDRFAALQLCNGIFGGFAHSKLFVNVREKHSLAYYCHSRILDGNLGLLMVQAGIDSAKRQEAQDIIFQQLQNLKNGLIDSHEVAQTKSLTLNALRSLVDSPHEMIAFDFANQYRGMDRTVEERIHSIEQTSVEQIAEAAQSMDANVVYFLHGNGGEAQ